LYEELKQMLLPFVIGIALSAGVALFARQVGLDRDRAFYPTVTIVIASYYVLFAAMGGSVQTVIIESLVMTLFAAAAVAGFKSSAWIVVVALAGHGVFDAVHGYVIENAGVGLGPAGVAPATRVNRSPCVALTPAGPSKAIFIALVLARGDASSVTRLRLRRSLMRFG
jgi:hypothetical protein